MASGGHRMPPNPHIVGRIEESRIDARPVADDPLQKSVFLGVVVDTTNLEGSIWTWGCG